MTCGGPTDIHKLLRKIYDACAQLERLEPNRKFTPDGHLVGSLGDMWAARTLNLTLVPQNTKGHDAKTRSGKKVEIKTTVGGSIALQAEGNEAMCLVVMRPDCPKPVWVGKYSVALDLAGKEQKNGQKQVAISKLVEFRRG